MYIFSQKKDLVVNTDRITCFSVFLEDVYDDDKGSKWILTADEYQIGEFPTEKDAKRILNEIISLTMNGTHQVYTVE